MLLTNLGIEVSRALLGVRWVVDRFVTPTKELRIHDFDRKKRDEVARTM